MNKEPLQYEALMTPAEVAAALRVDVKTVQRWAKKGLLDCLRTPGGHRRYRRVQVESFTTFRNERDPR